MTCRYRFDDVEIDLQGFRLTRAGKPIPVEPKALHLLVFLVENPGRLVSRRELIDAVWSGAFVTDHVLNRAIGQLRKQLEDDAKEPRYIETVPTLGYRFIAKVEREEVETAAHPGGAAESDSGELHTVLKHAGSFAVGAAAEGTAPAVERVPRGRNLAALGLALGLVVCLAGGLLAARILRARGAVSIRSLVVLPLENLSGDPGQQYLADGVTDELITNLGQIGSLRVISGTTAMQYKDAHKPLPQIARELNVDAVVQGSVERSGDRIRISEQLVAAQEDKLVWAHSYEGDFRDVLSLQSEAAGAVAEQIRIKLTAQEQSQFAARQRVDPRAYEALLKGDYFFEENTQEAARKSLEYYKQAASIDPNLARAYVGIARSYNFLGEGAVTPGEATAASDAAIAKALQLDPNLAEAYTERGWTLLFYHWDFPGAERDFRHAIELDPGMADAHEGYGMYLAAMGRFSESLEQLKIARDLDPLSTMTISDYCRALTYARHYDEAKAQCTAALELDPNYQFALWNASTLYLLVKDFPKANALLAKLGESDKLSLDAMDEVYGAPGKSGAFDRWLNGQKTMSDFFYLAQAYALLGRKDEALAALEKAYEHRSSPHAMTFTAVDPSFDLLRADPQFDAFLRNSGLPPQLAALVALAAHQTKN